MTVPTVLFDVCRRGFTSFEIHVSRWNVSFPLSKDQRKSAAGKWEWMDEGLFPPQSRYICFEVRCFSLFIPEVGVQTLLFPANGKYK